MPKEIINLSSIKIEEFLFSFSLYKEVHISTDNDLFFLHRTKNIDYFNPFIDEKTTFTHKTTTYSNPSISDRDIMLGEKNLLEYEIFFQVGGYCSFVMECARKHTPIYFAFFFDKEKSTLQKIGQYPSLATFEELNVRNEFKKIIQDEDANDLSKAIGLHAHGIGAGALVYLRRVFENIIFQTWAACKDTIGIPEDDFKQKRMNEKIEILKDHLPETITQNGNIYGLLSKGIHELDEDTCKNIFPVLKEIILTILEERKALEEKNLRKAELNKQLNAFASYINNP